MNPAVEMCAVEDCDKPAASHRQYCHMHQRRVWKNGSPHIVKRAHSTGDKAGYSGAHRRVRTSRGPATAHACVDCGGRANDWSYIGGAPDERAALGTGLPYSLNFDYYVPRCRTCHNRLDKGRQTKCRRAGHDWSIPRNLGVRKNGRRYCAECDRIRQRQSYLGTKGDR